MDAIDPQQTQRLEKEANIWLATLRPDGRPHLVPIWFIWWDSEFYLLMADTSVKARNLLTNPHASLALENGRQPLIAECTSRSVGPPYEDALQMMFKQKYDWDICNAGPYNAMFALSPIKWLSWEA